jgi:hypothetical protein
MEYCIEVRSGPLDEFERFLMSINIKITQKHQRFIFANLSEDEYDLIAENPDAGVITLVRDIDE